MAAHIMRAGSAGGSNCTQRCPLLRVCTHVLGLSPPCSVATVLKAVCVATNTKVIIKAYYKSKMHPKHYHKLQREIDAMKCLNGPYVTEFYAHFEGSQCIYIVMEFCEGGDLFKTMLMHGGLLDEQWVCVEVRMRSHALCHSQHSAWQQLAQQTTRPCSRLDAAGWVSARAHCGSCSRVAAALHRAEVRDERTAADTSFAHAHTLWCLLSQVITPLLRILEKMHSMMLLHRDIKPENIFLTGMGKFKIGDLGLAIRFDKELAFSRSGTLDYMSPEVGWVGAALGAVGSCSCCMHASSAWRWLSLPSN